MNCSFLRVAAIAMLVAAVGCATKASNRYSRIQPGMSVSNLQRIPTASELPNPFADGRAVFEVTDENGRVFMVACEGGEVISKRYLPAVAK